MIIRGLFLFGAFVFVIFTALQFNDATQYGNHDAWTWIALYGVMAGLNIASLVWKIKIEWLYAWAGFTNGSLLFRLQDAQGNLHLEWLHPANYWDPTGTTMIQESNESGGLLILAIWAVLSVWLYKKHLTANNQPSSE